MDQAKQENVTGSEATASEMPSHGGENASTRKRLLAMGPYLSVWGIRPNQLPNPSDGPLSQIETTFIQKSNEKSGQEGFSISLYDYVSDRVGWVAPLMDGLTQVSQAATSSKDHALGKSIGTDFYDVANVPMRVDAYRRDWISGYSPEESRTRRKVQASVADTGAETGESPNEKKAEESQVTHDEVNRKLRRLGQSLRKDFVKVQRDSPDVHLVVYLCPSWELRPSDSSWWLEDCKQVVSGFANDRLEENSDLTWRQNVSNWLAMICTPWATFVTLKIPEKHLNHVMEARIRHLVVDPVILATAHQTQVQKFVTEVANLSYLSQDPASGASRRARDDFYRWRSAFWWAQPAKATIANRVWRAAAETNNTISQVDALSQEMHDYASVEEARNKQQAEQWNVRLAIGALIFAVLAIAVPLSYEEFGFMWALIVGGAILLVSAAAIGVWSLQRRIKSAGSRQRGERV